MQLDSQKIKMKGNTKMGEGNQCLQKQDNFETILTTFWNCPTNFYTEYSVSLRNVSHYYFNVYFNDVLTTFLGLESFSCVAVYAGSESSWIS